MIGRWTDQPDDRGPGNGLRKPEPSREEAALRIIEEYIADLRAIIKKLTRRPH